MCNTSIFEDKNKTYYEHLGISKTADEAAIKKAYYKLALKVHPDKNPDNEFAKEDFQKLGRIVAILTDKEKRKFYDDFGDLDGNANDPEELNPDELFEHVLKEFKSKKFTKDDINDYFKKGENLDQNSVSIDEDRELRTYYTKFNGNLKEICEFVVPAKIEPEKQLKERYHNHLASLIEKGELPLLPKFKQLNSKQKAKVNKNTKNIDNEEDIADEDEDDIMDSDQEIKKSKKKSPKKNVKSTNSKVASKNKRKSEDEEYGKKSNKKNKRNRL